MLKNYSIEYSLHFRRHTPPERLVYFTDDPVAVEEFVENLLEHRMALLAIKHEGVDLPKLEFDRLVKLAAARAASKLICASLNIKADEERHRFGFAA